MLEIERSMLNIELSKFNEQRIEMNIKSAILDLIVRNVEYQTFHVGRRTQKAEYKIASDWM